MKSKTPHFFHIGIPKSGTTTIQKVLESDPRIFLTRSSRYSNAFWWKKKSQTILGDKIVVESNETLSSNGYGKVKFHQVIKRLYNTNPDAKIILTIRAQESAILSMYKYHIKNNFVGTKSLQNWMYHTNLGVDYLSLCMYSDIIKVLELYFNKTQIHILCFEELKNNPKTFYEKLYKIFDLEPIKKQPLTKAYNTMIFNENQLYFLSLINRMSFTKNNSETHYKYKKVRTLEQLIKFKLIRLFDLKPPTSFFKIEAVEGYQKLKAEYIKTNQELIEFNYVTREELKAYQYLI